LDESTVEMQISSGRLRRGLCIRTPRWQSIGRFESTERARIAASPRLSRK